MVSIIIPCKEVNHHTQDCVERCKRLDYGKYEILVLPDSATANLKGVKMIPTGPKTPGAKRNIGVAKSEGELCAFIDSDAYPRSDWLNNAVTYFEDPTVAAVGGPGLTPLEDDVMQRASGQVLSSLLVGSLSSRYKAEKCSESDDVHSCNFIVRKSVLIEAGGWNEKFWPGEDTLVCLAIKKLGRRLVEASDVVVYHHRRSLFKAHFRQVWRFGEHRGFFFKKYRGNSFRFTYLAPTLFVSSLFAGVIISLFSSLFSNVFLIAITAYLLFCLVTILWETKEAKLILPTWLGIIATHVSYGASFLVGLLRRDLKR